MTDEIKRYVMSSIHLIQDYEKKGRYYHSLSPNDNSPVVVHKQTNQLTYVVDGRGIVVLNGETIEIKPDSVVLIEAGVTHQFKACTEKLTLFHIHIPDEGRDKDRYIVRGEDYERYE